MNVRNAFLWPATLIVGLFLALSPAMATKLAGPMITGRVTAISGVESVSIEGQPYRIQAGSAAATVLPSLTVGEVVDATLDGPATSSASEIVAIVPHSS